jgi:hypothetical protein
MERYSILPGSARPRWVALLVAFMKASGMMKVAPGGACARIGNTEQMKEHRRSPSDAKAAKARRKIAINERLDREAQIASEKIRLRFDAERQALARRYGAALDLSSEATKN